MGFSTRNAGSPHFQIQISPSLVNEFSKFWYLEKAETLLFQKHLRFAWFWNSETQYIATYRKSPKSSQYSTFWKELHSYIYNHLSHNCPYTVIFVRKPIVNDRNSWRPLIDLGGIPGWKLVYYCAFRVPIHSHTCFEWC